MVPRRDRRNEETRNDLGLTTMQLAEEVKKLKYTDYYRGPSPDHDKSTRMWWEFGKEIKGQEVYIKITVYTSDSGKKFGKCMSCHFPDEGKPINYPYKEERG